MTTKSKLLSVMESTESIASTGIVHHALNDDSLIQTGNICEFCAHCLNHPQTRSLCRYACRGAALQSITSGEPCYQRCWAGLLYITVAVAPGDICTGGLSIGGFYSSGEETETTRMVCEQLADMNTRSRNSFLAKLHTVREISAADLRGLGLLLFENTISSGINSASFLKKQNDKYLQQRNIAESYESIRQERPKQHDLLSETDNLVQFLHGKDREESVRIISSYLARVLMMSSWSLDKLKAHAKIITSIISSREIMSGADWQTTTAREMRLINRLFECQSVEDCCLEITDQVLRHLDRSGQSYERAGSVSDKAVRYIETNFSRPFSLEEMARAIGASMSSLTHSVKQDTGSTCNRIIQETRIAEAKKLLATSDMDLTSIALACGFFDQSHFCRTFKRHVNLTPGKFRALLDFSSADI